jgi:hypothetical protein
MHNTVPACAPGMPHPSRAFARLTDLTSPRTVAVRGSQLPVDRVSSSLLRSRDREPPALTEGGATPDQSLLRASRLVFLPG